MPRAEREKQIAESHGDAAALAAPTRRVTRKRLSNQDMKKRVKTACRDKDGRRYSGHAHRMDHSPGYRELMETGGVPRKFVMQDRGPAGNAVGDPYYLEQEYIAQHANPWREDSDDEILTMARGK